MIPVKRLSAALGLVIAMIGASIIAAAPPGVLQWDDLLDTGPVFDRANAVASASEMVFAAGETHGSEVPGSTDWTVRAYSSRDGSLVWMDRFDRAGLSDAPSSVAADERRVVAAGLVRTPFPLEPGDTPARFRNYFVRAYDRKTGEVAWQDEINRGGRETATDVAINGGTAYVSGIVGTCPAQPVGNCDFFVRAYGAVDGRVLWDDTYDPDGGYDVAQGVAANGKLVAVVGSVAEPDGGPRLTVRTYDARSGDVKWTDELSIGGFALGVDVQIEGDIVVATGIGGADCLPDPSTDCDILLRAYRGSTGELLWQAQFDGSAHYDEVRSLALSNKTAYIAGYSHSATDEARGLVAAFDLGTGMKVWQDLLALGSGETSLLLDVEVKGSAVAVTGGGGADCVGFVPFSNCDWLVRVYDARTGALQWSDRHDRAGGDDTGNALVIDSGLVIAVGGTQEAFGEEGNFDWGVRAFKLQPGGGGGGGQP